MKKLAVLLTILVGVISLFGCGAYTTGQRQSVYQGGTTALGAAVGQVLGGDTKSTLIGAGVGFATGGLTKEFVHPRQDQKTVVVQQHQPVYQHQYRGRVGHIPPPRLMEPTGNARRWARTPRYESRFQAKDRVYRRAYRQWERQERAIGRAEGELEAYRNLNRNQRFFNRY